MAPPPSNGVFSPIIGLAVRILTLIFVFISVIVLSTITADNDGEKTKFNDFYAYRYLLATTVLGLVYTLLQTALTILQVATGNRIGGDLRFQLDFYGDKIVSYLLATGAAASFGMTQDIRRIPIFSSEDEKFLNGTNAAASMCLLGFLCCAVSSVFSAYALPKRVD